MTPQDKCTVGATGYHFQLGGFGSTVEECVALVTPESAHVPVTPPLSPGMEVPSPGQESLHHGQVTGPGGQVEGGVSSELRKINDVTHGDWGNWCCD